MMKLVIEGRLPSLNEYVDAERSNRYKGAKMKREAQDVIGWAIRQQHLKPITRPVIIHYLWVTKDKRMDKDNICFAQKFAQDALVECGILPNDGWDEIVNSYHNYEVDKARPRVEIEIQEDA